MKIGYYQIYHYPRGGTWNYTRHLSRSMARISGEDGIYFLTTRHKARKLRNHFTTQDNIHYNTDLLHPSMLGSVGAPLIRLINQWKWEMISKKMDIIHFTDTVRFPRVKISNFVATIHDLTCFYEWNEMTKAEEAVKLNVPFIVKHSRLICVPSHFVAQELLKYFPDSEGKVWVTYEATHEQFRPTPLNRDLLRKWGLDPKTSYFLYVGDIFYRKNLLRLIEAFATLPRNIQEKFKLVFIAGDGSASQKRKVYEKVRDLSLSERFLHLAGISDSDLVHLYNGAFACVYPSLSEGFGLPILEAMQCGCPVITSNCSSMPEVAGDAAILVDPYNVESIRDGMLQLIEKPDLRQSLTKKGFQRAKEFSWEKTAQETYKGYQAVLRGEVS
ncbi:MAG: glycosyltransferase family 4 protein [Deltaproteobacteria bacterium]|nr:glycosyltransferase family 4 protein [Deltaproteobacteria bacterium]